MATSEGFSGVVPEPHQHPVRAAILDYLRATRSSFATELCARLGLSWGGAYHHLRVLRQAGLIHCVRRGRTNILFGPGEIEAERPIHAALRSTAARGLAQAILETPLCDQRTLCVRLGLTRKMFRRHLDQLAAVGLVLESERGRCRRYEPTALLRDHASTFSLASPAIVQTYAPETGQETHIAVTPGA